MNRQSRTADMTLSFVDKSGTVVWIRQQGPMNALSQIPCLVILTYINDTEKHMHNSSRHVYEFDRMARG